MKKMPLDSSLSKSKTQVILEYILFALCLCVIAFRTTYTEGPVSQPTNPTNLNTNLYSLSVSAVLILSFAFWFILGFCSKRFFYRFTALEIGLCLLCTAAVIAGFAASNKRAAITDAICLISPVLMAIVLVQILDSLPKIKLVLAVIAALGVVSVSHCAWQIIVGNQAMIYQYEQAPHTMLEPLGIENGSFQHFLFEHLLYSKDVRGFFTTGNSAGSFAILASFAALAIFIDKFKKHQSEYLSLITCNTATVIIILGLIITRSKGAIGAFLIAMIIFVTFLYFGNWLKTHKKAILVICLILFSSIVSAAVAYGITHDRLPGGNSMLVRWQYWLSAAKMYADHPFTGVGPGNFAHFYTHYKPAAALESVADPHNFLLSILTQYGPLGLIGFLALFFIPLWKYFPSKTGFSPQAQSQLPFRTLAKIYLPVLSAVLLFIRPLLMPTILGNTLEVTLYLIFILYIAPVTAFAVGFWLLTTNTNPSVINHESQVTYIPTALFCAAIGLLLHNLIDFAIFEPPVFTAFCAIIACLIAINYQQNPQPSLVIKPTLPVRIILSVYGLVLIGAFFSYAFVPVAKTSSRNQQAIRKEQPFEYAHRLLHEAAEQDPLDPTSLNLNGRLYLQHYNETQHTKPILLNKAEACFLAAIARDKADFKNYDRLSDVYTLLARQTALQSAKSDWLNLSFDSLRSAIERYPTSDRLRFELAEVAEHLGKTDIAFEQYRKAVEIEDAYRNQFKIMYPGCELFSRLGEEKYNYAKQRIKSLSEQPSP